MSGKEIRMARLMSTWRGTFVAWVYLWTYYMCFLTPAIYLGRLMP